MVSSYIYSLEPYVIVLYLFHTVISLVLAIVLSAFTATRFKRESEAILARDARRLKEVSYRGYIYRKLFNVSLHKNNRVTNIIFIFLLNFAMPVIGYAISAWITWYLKNVTYEKRVSNTNILNLDEFGVSFLKVERIFGEGSMIDLMNSKYAPRSKKLKALSSLSASLTPANLRIIKTTLSSTDDEIRMFGYATINKAEKSLSLKINKYLEIYKEEQENGATRDQAREADAAKELATLYWEMVYTELSHESLKGGFLKEIKKYIKIAKKYYVPKSHSLQEKLDDTENEFEIALEKEQNDSAKNELTVAHRHKMKEIKDRLLKYNDVTTKLYVLMGKVYMNENNYERAITEFTVAQELYEGSSSFILPYLAEIQFLTGNYSIVHAIMSRSEALSLNATLHPIVEQWKSS